MSLFELLDCQPSICSFLRLSARRKATVNSEFTKERGSGKKPGMKCLISIQKDQWVKEGGDREERGERGEKEQGEVESLRKIQLNINKATLQLNFYLITYFSCICFSYIVPFLYTFSLKLSLFYPPL